jgi:hypothetical protein
MQIRAENLGILADDLPEAAGTMKSEVLYTTSKILRKPSLTNDEKVTAELFLSSIVHTLNSFSSSCLPVSIIETLNQLPMESKGMEDETVKVFDILTEVLTDAESLNLKISKLKIELAGKGKTHSEQHVMLNILSRVADGFPLWREDSCESETTFYRRFSNLLDVLNNLLFLVINGINDEDSDTSINNTNGRRYCNMKTHRNLKYIFFFLST